MMKLEKIKDKKIWESFFLNSSEKTFLQSWNWGNFNQAMGNKIWRLGVIENNELLALALVVKIKAKRGTFFLVPHGPIMREEKLNCKSEILEFFLKNIKEIAQREKADFVRIAPLLERNEENKKIFENLKFKKAPIHIHPETTWELEIYKKEEDILREMRKTTRYLIRQLEKNQKVHVYQSKNLEDLNIFYEIYFNLSKQEHFTPFSLNYLKNEFLSFLADDQVSLFLAKYDKEILGGGFFIFWQEIAFYHHGASLKKHSKIPISYLILWEAIKEAKKRNCKKFNFWGIIDGDFKGEFDLKKEKFKKHPWRGLTFFKMGFGGYKKEYLKTQDFPLSFKYYLNFILEKMRKIKRGL